MYTEDSNRTMTASFECPMGRAGVMKTHSDTQLCTTMSSTCTMQFLSINIVVFLEL